MNVGIDDLVVVGVMMVQDTVNTNLHKNFIYIRTVILYIANL